MAALSLTAASAPAQMRKDQCVDANMRAQHLRDDGKMSAAREQLRRCADVSCPALVRSDCTKRLDDLENAQPTIAFEAKDGGGADLVAVKVIVDGQPLADKLDGTALPVDPGPHVFVFEAAGLPPVTRTLVLTEGEKGRRENVVLAAPLPPPPVPGVPASGSGTGAANEPAVVSGTGMGTPRIVGLVGGGIGLAGLAVGSAFGLLTVSRKNQQESVCGSPCSAPDERQALADHSSGVTDGAISTVGFIAGGAFLVGGAVLFFTAGSSSHTATSAGIRLVPSVGPGGGGLWLGREF